MEVEVDETVSLDKTPRSTKKYFLHLAACMSLKDGVLYTKNHHFEKRHLLTLTPRDVCNYFNLKVFGTPSPDEDATSRLGRSSSLMFYKKSISYFMPNKLMGWNVETKSGNPTKSIEVNQLVKKVQKMEVRKQGKVSQAKRPLTIDGFKFTLKQLRKTDDCIKKFALTAFCAFQFHLIARIDGTCQFHLNELRAHRQFEFALVSRMCWSKNVMEERHAPTQVVLGANDPDFYTLLNLGIYL